MIDSGNGGTDPIITGCLDLDDVGCQALFAKFCYALGSFTMHVSAEIADPSVF